MVFPCIVTTCEMVGRVFDSIDESGNQRVYYGIQAEFEDRDGGA
jgi:hypothetical protein